MSGLRVSSTCLFPFINRVTHNTPAISSRIKFVFNSRKLTSPKFDFNSFWRSISVIAPFLSNTSTIERDMGLGLQTLLNAESPGRVFPQHLCDRHGSPFLLEPFRERLIPVLHIRRYRRLHPFQTIPEILDRNTLRIHIPPQRDQARLTTDRFKISARVAGGLARDLLQINIPRQRHVPRMNLQNIQPRQMVRSRHIDQPVKPSRTKNRRINNVRPVRSTNNDNIDQRLDPVQLRQQLANHPLRDAAIAKTHAPPRNHRVELVEEDDRRSSSPPLAEHFPDSLLRLAHPLAEQHRSLYRDEVRLALRRYSPRQHSLPTSRRPEQ